MKWEYKHMIPSLAHKPMLGKNKDLQTLPVVETMGYVINTDSNAGSAVYRVCCFAHVPAVRWV